MRVFPIVFTCDDKYFKYTDVVITSILSNQNRNVHYEIHILTEFISEENKQKAISQLKPHENFSITFHELGNIDKSSFYLNSYMSVSTYYRFYLSEIFMNYDRILYLDSDLIVNADISAYIDMDFEDKLAICSSSPYIKNKVLQGDDPDYPVSYFTEVLKMPNPDEYFNAGVVLYNLKKMREMDIQQKLFDTLKEIPEPKLQDQDILNSVFSRNGGVKLISNFYNNTATIRMTPNRLLLESVKKKVGIKANHCFYIYHYVGKVKPWQRDGVDSGLFLQYAYKSPFFDDIIEANQLDKQELIKKYRLNWL